MVLLRSKIDKKEIADMPKEAFQGRIFVINSEDEAQKAVNYLNSSLILGVDTETKPSFKKGSIHKVALLQISSGDTCFLFRLNNIGLPDFLDEFLQNDILKIGLSLKDDFLAMRKRNEGDLKKGNWIELQDYVTQFGIQDKSLQKIYAILFNKKISKTQRLSNWEADTLTEAQCVYAATDAWACVEIYNYLESLRISGDYEIEKIQIENDK